MMNVYLTHTGQFTARHGHGGTLAEEIHEHTFHYEITFYGPLNAEGYLLDFRQIAQVLKEHVNTPLAGKDLGSFLPNPTTEALTIWLFERLQNLLPYLYSVKVAEEPDRWIEYKGER